MTLLRLIAQNPGLAFLASVFVVALVAFLQTFVGFGADVPRFGDE